MIEALSRSRRIILLAVVWIFREHGDCRIATPSSPGSPTTRAIQVGRSCESFFHRAGNVQGVRSCIRALWPIRAVYRHPSESRPFRFDTVLQHGPIFHEGRSAYRSEEFANRGSQLF